MDSKVLINLLISDSSENELDIIFSVYNGLDTTIYFDTFLTPLESIFQNCLVVKQNNELVIPFDGMYVNHDYRLENEYIKIESKKSVQKLINIHDHYNLNQVGMYTLKLSYTDFSIYKIDSFTNEKIYLDNDQVYLQNISCNLIITEKDAFKEKKTIGKKEREKNKSLKSKLLNGIPKCETIFKGEEDTEITNKINQLHQDVYQNTIKVIKYLESESNHIFLQIWFGIDDFNFKMNYLLNEFRTIKLNLENNLITYEIIEVQDGIYLASCGGRDVDNICTTISLYPLFFSLPDEGIDAKSGTIIHEFSHAIAANKTSDIAYGRKCCYMLVYNNSNNNLEKSYTNADNFQGFAEDVCLFNRCSRNINCSKFDCCCGFEKDWLKCKVN